MKFLTGLATFAVVTGMIVVPPEVNVAVLTRDDYEIIDDGEDE